jgi:hypothetical protein
MFRILVNILGCCGVYALLFENVLTQLLIEILVTPALPAGVDPI